MPVYLLHVPADSTPGDPAALVRAVLVKDGFSWSALIFQVFWCLWHRLWLAAAGLLAAILGLSAIAGLIGLSPVFELVAGLLLAVLFAHEANMLRRSSLEKRGFRLADIVLADNLSLAEARAFDRWLTGRSQPAPATQAAAKPTSAMPKPGSAVIGLFPEPEIRA